ncbi:MAG: DEAD/DEAH box helicase [Candidatus Wildermuthbacteria bacterium]|nr:DEAD/DEAH box helicase [Candidatus Wildermuthbacteria bacterium]
MAQPSGLEKLLIVSITPYFLEKGNVWFEEHFNEIAKARETQPFFQTNTILLEKGLSCSFSQLLRNLDELGYEKVFEISDPGEFTYRGGILEVFPINRNNAVRIEFFGNTVETIGPLPITITDEKKSKELLKKRLKSQELFSDLKGLKEGDYLVHLDHGVARFAGIKNFQTKEQSAINNQQYYVLEYAAGDTLFVPQGLERKLSRYVGFSDPHVSRLGSIAWQKAKRKIKEGVEKLAKELLELYAKREVTTRPAYKASAEIEERINASFPYQETPDQLRALEDIKQNLASINPMDRIVCGDVGFGKTEIALRTMALSVENGYQAALLAPTTILAYQHFQNFKQRLKDLPINIALLSRLQTKKEQGEIIRKTKDGQVDMVVGTHRLLSADVSFQNLGLLVIDDEQRFGVKQKEKLREMRGSLYVLCLSATPIART